MSNQDEGEILDGDRASVPTVEEVTIDPKGLTDALLKQIVDAESKKMIAGLIGGLIVIGAGVVLLILGVSGEVDFELTNGERNAKLSTAAVGVVVALIGIGVIWITRFKLVVGKQQRVSRKE